MKQLILLVLLFTGGGHIFAQQLTPQDNGSDVKFYIKNFGINTGGSLNGLTGVIKYDTANPLAASFDVSVSASTIDTDIEARDNHLRKAEYLNATQYPLITIRSTRITRTNSPEFLYFFGTLTIKGISKEIKFPFSVKSMNGGYVFEGEFTINRRDFNVGGRSLSLSDDLDVKLSVFAK